MDSDRAAAKRRASFGRADRLKKEGRQKAEQAKADQRRREQRDKADRQRKADAVKAAEQRNAQARKRAEQRRLEWRREHVRKEFARKAEDRRAQEARAEQVRRAEAVKSAARKEAAERDPRQRDAAAYVALQEQRQLRDQQDEHRRQTHRLRVEHQAQREGARHREAAAIITHARQIRNIDIAERRELETLDERRRSLTGRVVGLVGPKHFARQEQAIAARHEDERWQKHREHEARKDNLFWVEQSARLRRVTERADLAKSHRTERLELTQAQDRSRVQHVRSHAQALERLAQIPVERLVRQDNARPAPAFELAAGRSHELKR